MAEGTTTRTTVLIPAFNEHATIRKTVADVLAVLDESDQVLVIDDGSTDDTAQLAYEAGATVLRLDSNRGKGVALREGFKRADGRYVVTIDADGQDDPSELPLLVLAVENGADLAIGSRFLGRFHPKAISRLNRLATHFFNGLINTLYRARITDSQAGFRCFRRELVEKLVLNSSEYEIETEMLVKALRAGATVVDIPVKRFARGGGATSFSRVRHGLRILATILRNLK